MHDVFKIVRWHLPMCEFNYRLGNLTPYLHHDLFKILDPVMKEEHLSAPLYFHAHRSNGLLKIELLNVCLNRKTFTWSCGKKTHIPDFQKGHVKSTRDRSRTEGEAIDVGLQLLYPLLILDSKTLLFINNQEAKVFEPHLSKNLMCTEKNIDIPSAETLKNLFLLPG